jgi:hypothetical protein
MLACGTCAICPVMRYFGMAAIPSGRAPKLTGDRFLSLAGRLSRPTKDQAKQVGRFYRQDGRWVPGRAMPRSAPRLMTVIFPSQNGAKMIRSGGNAYCVALDCT